MKLCTPYPYSRNQVPHTMYYVPQARNYVPSTLDIMYKFDKKVE